MAQAVAGAKARKILIPFSKCSVVVAGLGSSSLDACVREAAEIVLQPPTENQ
jgi:hypothetical protein